MVGIVKFYGYSVGYHLYVSAWLYTVFIC